MNTSIKYGIIGGLIYVILQMGLYLVSPELMFDLSSVAAFMVLLVIIFIVCSVYAIRAKRKGLNGFITFKQAFTESFITVVVISVLLNVFNFVLYAVIDPSLEEQLREFTMNSVAQWMDGVPDEQFDEIMAEMEDQDLISPLSTLGGIIQFIIYGSIIGAITSLIMRKEDPEEAYRKAHQQSEDNIDL